MVFDEFSDTNGPDDYCDYCQKGNLFMLDMPQTCQDSLALRAFVNHEPTQQLPIGRNYIHDNTLAGSIGPLDLQIQGQQYRLIDDLSQFNKEAPEDVQLYIGVPEDILDSTPAEHTLQTLPFSPIAPEQALETLPQPTPEQVEGHTVITVQMHPDQIQGIAAPAEGVYNIDNMSDDQVCWFAVALIQGMDFITPDAIIELREKTTANGISAVDLSFLGTNTPPALIDTLALFVRGNDRAFLREMWGENVGKFWKNGNTWMLSFKGNARLRSFINAVSYGTANPKVNAISAYAQAGTGQTGALIKGAIKGNAIAFIFVGAIDIAEHFSKPEDERVLTDLLVDLGMDFAKIAISSILAAVAIGAAVLAGLTAPVWLIVAGGIGLGILIGVGLDALDAYFGITESLKRNARIFMRHWHDAHFGQALSTASAQIRATLAALDAPYSKLLQMQWDIRQAPQRLSGRRPSPATTPELIGAIILDIMLERNDIRRQLFKSAVDAEGRFLIAYEGEVENMELKLAKAITGRDLTEIGFGLGHMNVRTVRDLVANNYLRTPPDWSNDSLDIALNWLLDETRVPVLVGARLARISQYWKHHGVDISEKPEILASLYYMGLTGRHGVHNNPQPNDDGERITALMPLVSYFLYPEMATRG